MELEFSIFNLASLLDVKGSKWILGPTSQAYGIISLMNLLDSQPLKQKFSLWWSIDCYSTYLGSQATFYGSHKISILLWPVCFGKGLSSLDQKNQKSNVFEFY